jgi:hypothetical protein
VDIQLILNKPVVSSCFKTFGCAQGNNCGHSYHTKQYAGQQVLDISLGVQNDHIIFHTIWLALIAAGEFWEFLSIK